MDTKKEIRELTEKLSNSSNRLNKLIRGLRPQNELKQKLTEIETNINKAISKLAEIEEYVK